jgi:hypothetical protein
VKTHSMVAINNVKDRKIPLRIEPFTHQVNRTLHLSRPLLGIEPQRTRHGEGDPRFAQAKGGTTPVPTPERFDEPVPTMPAPPCHRSLWTGTMGLSVTGASGVGTVSGVAAASLSAWR